jgi:hypothetical protein
MNTPETISTAVRCQEFVDVVARLDGLTRATVATLAFFAADPARNAMVGPRVVELAGRELSTREAWRSAIYSDAHAGSSQRGWGHRIRRQLRSDFLSLSPELQDALELITLKLLRSGFYPSKRDRQRGATGVFGGAR